MKGKQINPNQLAGKIASLERQISQLPGKQTATPKRKAEKRGPRGENNVFMHGAYPTETTSMSKVPRISSNDRVSVISGREIVNTITGTFAAGVCAGQTSSLQIDFGSGTFGWLKRYAQLYDMYRFKYLRLYFQPLLSTTFSGAFGSYFDPEFTDASAASFSALSQNAGAMTCSIHQTMGQMVTRDKLDRLPWYNVTQSDQSGTNGVFHWAITSINAVTPIVGTLDIGFIWLEYSVELKNPTSA